jgi:hypothetical protein
MIHATTEGYFEADIDWSIPYDGMIKEEKIGYTLTRLTNGYRSPSMVKN